MHKRKLGVNIDHVATIRNARGENYPDPLKAALLSQMSGADSITIHLREDRRHIKDSDLKKIKKNIKIPLNLEIAPTKEMLKIALKEKKAAEQLEKAIDNTLAKGIRTIDLTTDPLEKSCGCKEMGEHILQEIRCLK